MPKFGAQIDTMRIPVKGFITDSGAAFPASPVEGLLFHRTDLKQYHVYLNGAWHRSDNQGTSVVGHLHAIADVTGLTAALAAKVDTTRTITAGTGLSGGGDLSANRTLAVVYGTAVNTAAQGNDSRLSDSRAPNGTAGGDLTGTYPNPTIAALAVSDAEIAVANKDGAVGTPSMRTIGTGAQQAMAGNTRLDQVAVPTAPVAMNNQPISGLPLPWLPSHAANKQYVDDSIAGLDIHESVKVSPATNTVLTNVTATSAIMPTNVLDGVTLQTGDRFLLRNQSTAAQNGLWTVYGQTPADTTYDIARATDGLQGKLQSGAFVFVEQGNAADQGFVMTTDGAITIGTTALAWSQFSASAVLNPGTGLTQSGSTFNVIGTAARIAANADSIDIDAAYAGQTSITTLGTVATGTWNATAIGISKGGTGGITAAGARTALSAAGIFNVLFATALVAGVYSASINHGLNDLTPNVNIVEASTGEQVLLDWKVIDANNVQIKSDVNYALNTLRVSVVG